MSSFIRKLKNAIKFTNRTDGTIESKIIRSSFWVGISNIGVITLSFVRTIVLARLLTPDIFGLMGICMIAIRGVEVFSQTGFSAALIHRQSSFEEAKDTAFTLLIFRGCILALITFFIAPLITIYYERQELEAIIMAISICFIFNGLHNINTIALEKELDFKRLAYLQQTRTVIATVITIILVYSYRNVWALVIGQIADSFIGAILSFIIISGRPRLLFNKKVAKELFSYGKFITGITIILFIATEIDKVLIGRLLGIDNLGYYAIAFTLATLPRTYISKLASRIMLPAYSKLQNDLPSLRELYLKVFKIVATIAIPISIGIGILAPEIVKVLYGEKWLPAVEVLPILCVYGCINTFTSMNGYLLNAIGRPDIPFYFGIARLSIVILLIYPLISKYKLVGASIAVIIPLVFILFAGMYFVSRLIGLNTKKVIVALFVTLGYSFIMSVVIFYLKQNILIDNMYTLSFLIFIGMFTYMLLNGRDIFHYLKRRKFNTK